MASKLGFLSGTQSDGKELSLRASKLYALLLIVPISGLNLEPTKPSFWAIILSLKLSDRLANAKIFLKVQRALLTGLVGVLRVT